MAKIYTDEEICYLRENPNVRVIKRDRLILTYEFRCHLYDAYMANGRRGIRVGFEQVGIPCKMIGLDVIRHLCCNVDKRRPVNCSGTAPSTKNHLNTPSGNWSAYFFQRLRTENQWHFLLRWLRIVCGRRYLDVTVGSALKELGVDPDLVFLETIGDSTFHLLQCAEERILWSCPGKDTSDQSEASRSGQR